MARQEVGLPIVCRFMRPCIVSIVEQFPAAWDTSRGVESNKQLERALLDNVIGNMAVEWVVYTCA